jgi:hypothetical protein
MMIGIIAGNMSILGQDLLPFGRKSAEKPKGKEAGEAEAKVAKESIEAGR